MKGESTGSKSPKTETQGRFIPASAVIVLPEAEEFDVELKDSEIKKPTVHRDPGVNQLIPLTQQ